MNIISEIPPLINEKFLVEQYNSTLYPLSEKIIDHISSVIDDSSSIVLFSGGSRLNFNAAYIEPQMFSKANINWKPQTLFIDPSQNKLINYTIKKLNKTNLIILNTSLFIKYRSWELILQDIQYYKTLVDRVIVSLPIERFDFNRLKFSSHAIASMMGGILLDDTIIICQ